MVSHEDNVLHKTSYVDEATEIVYLKEKNYELAKNLAEMQERYGDLGRDRDLLQEAFFTEKTKANLYANKLNDFASDCRTALAHVVGLSNTLTNILTKLTSNNQINLENKEKLSPQKQKTKAVQPMVGGCTISKPMIKLNRMSEQLLHRAMNGENRSEQNEIDANVAEPVVYIRRLPERLNLEELRREMETAEDEEHEEEAEAETEGERLQQTRLMHALSTILESTEQESSRSIRNQTVVQQSVSERSLDIGRSPLLLGFSSTSTPVERNRKSFNRSSEESTTFEDMNTSLFVTKRSTKRTKTLSPMKAKLPRKSSPGCRNSSPGSPRVVLRRLDVINSGGTYKLDRKSPVKRAKRAAAANVSYKEPSLSEKLRRNR